MNLPKSLWVGDELYEIEVVAGKVYLGKCDFRKKRIRLSNRLRGAELLSTLIHELLHAVEHEFAIPLKHSVVYKLEEAILSVCSDNGIVLLQLLDQLQLIHEHNEPKE